MAIWLGNFRWVCSPTTASTSHRRSLIMLRPSGQRSDLLADDESREIFVNHIEWRLFLDYDVLPPPSDEEIYFNDKYVTSLDTEVLYDIGAFTGDSIKSFLATTRGTAFSQIHSFEPSPNNYPGIGAVCSLVGLSCTARSLRTGLHWATGSERCRSRRTMGPSSRVGRGNVTRTNHDD